MFFTELKRLIKTEHHYLPFLLVPALLLLYRFLIIITFNPETAHSLQQLLIILLPFSILWSIIGIVQNRATNKPHLPPVYPSLSTYFSTLIAGLFSLSIIFSGMLLFIFPGLIVAKHFHLSPLFVIIKKQGPLEAMKSASLIGGKSWNILLNRFFIVLTTLGVGAAASLFILMLRTGFSLSYLLSVLINPTAIHELMVLSMMLLAFCTAALLTTAYFLSLDLETR